MGPIILMVLMAIVLYFALTYLRGPRNSGNDSDGITTRPFSGESAETAEGMPPEPGIEEVATEAEGDQGEVAGDSTDTLDDSAEATGSEPIYPDDQEDTKADLDE